MWVIIAGIISFALIFILVFRRISFGISMITGSILLGLLTLPIQELLDSILNALNPITLELSLTVTLITFLGIMYQETGKSREIDESLGEVISDTRVTVTIIPALFGCLPMLGGALLSCPMVDEQGKRLEMDSVRKAFINVWFRHVIFFIYPIGGLMAFASYLSGVDPTIIALYGLPTFAFALISGYIIGFRNIKVPKQETSKGQATNKQRTRKEAVRRFMVLISPILVSILLTILAGLKMFISLAAGVLLLILISKPSSNIIRSVARRGIILNMVLAPIGAMVFRNVLFGSKLVEAISNIIEGSSIPWIVLIVLFPLVLGLTMGTPMAPLAISIPTLSSMNTLTPPLVSLIFASSLIGYLFSPLHMCLIVTDEYFKVKMTDVYPMLISAALATIIMTTVVSALLI